MLEIDRHLAGHPNVQDRHEFAVDPIRDTGTLAVFDAGGQKRGRGWHGRPLMECSRKSRSIPSVRAEAGGSGAGAVTSETLRFASGVTYLGYAALTGGRAAASNEGGLCGWRR